MKYLFVILLLVGCGKAELEYPCNFYGAPASDNGSKCSQCFSSAEVENSYMEKFLKFYTQSDTAAQAEVAAAILSPTPGTDLYNVFIRFYPYTSAAPKGVCGQ